MLLKSFVSLGSAAGGAVGNTRSLVIRFLTGAWCVTCFVLITAFCSVLVSFLTAPEIYKPIIHSVNDLPMKRDIQVTVNKGLFPDIIFRVKSYILWGTIIQKAMQNRTVIIIAHRMSTIEKCDKIFVLEEGKVVEEGGFNELK